MIKIVIIGGGASGLMAAVQAARKGAQVTLLEQNEKTGKKILATGNGRCNMTNLYQDSSCYRSENPAYPWKIIEKFPLASTLPFFYELGIYTRDRNGWIYPYSDQSSSVAQVLEMEARHLKVRIKTREEVTDIQCLPEGFQVFTKTWNYPCDRVILCCGSHASSVEGSSAAGYELAKKLGHHIVEPMPALVALKGKGNYFSKWAGTRMEGILQLEIDKKITHKERGEILFTDYGISGIAVFQISRYAVRAISQGHTVTCHLDLMPDFSREELSRFLKERQASCSYKSMKELLVGFIPLKMISVLVPSKATLEDLVSNIKDWVLPIRDAWSLRQAQVCSGGVDTTELNENLESLLHPGLYFAGELVDVDGPCGGYNLQWAWSSGAVAGKAAADASDTERRSL